jgi:uncharacterized membrane protein
MSVVVPADGGSGGPFDLINGIPVHPLVVHLAVVVVPVAAIGLIVMVIRPTFSQRFGGWVAAVAAIAMGASFVAKEAGEALEERVGEPGFDHAELGDVMPILAGLLLLAVVALYVVDRYMSDQSPSRRILRIVAAVAAVVIAVANMVWIYRVGDSGAKSVWSGEVSSSTPASDTDND